MNKPIVYLDMDGVLADFARGLEAHGHYQGEYFQTPKHHWSQEDALHDKEVQRIMGLSGFFQNLPLMEGAATLWQSAGWSPCVLTALPKDPIAADRVKQEKRNWIEFHFGQIPDNRFVTCLRSEKRKYAVKSHYTFEYLKHDIWKTEHLVRNILVDDLKENCKEWGQAGGRAILYKTSEQAIKELKKEMNR